jgi:hypothetical protein
MHMYIKKVRPFRAVQFTPRKHKEAPIPGVYEESGSGYYVVIKKQQEFIFDSDYLLYDEDGQVVNIIQRKMFETDYEQLNLIANDPNVFALPARLMFSKEDFELAMAIIRKTQPEVAQYANAEFFHNKSSVALNLSELTSEEAVMMCAAMGMFVIALNLNEKEK